MSVMWTSVVKTKVPGVLYWYCGEYLAIKVWALDGELGYTLAHCVRMPEQDSCQINTALRAYLGYEVGWFRVQGKLLLKVNDDHAHACIWSAYHGYDRPRAVIRQSRTILYAFKLSNLQKLDLSETT
jgi:hypothetical protein